MSLTTTLNTAVGALGAETGALQITSNNIANANTPGYTRKVPVLLESAPNSNGGVIAGTGVVLTGYQSQRSQLLNQQIQQETQSQGSANAQLASLQQIQPTFTTSTQDVGTQLSAFFASISALSTNAANSPTRQAVISAGQNLAAAFNTASNALTTQQAGLNTQVGQDVNTINQLAQQIAALNPQIANLRQSGQDTGTLQDQQDQLVLNLSALTNVSVTRNVQGDTISTGNGTALVVGTQSFALQTTTGSAGTLQVLDHTGSDITTAIAGGDLGGTIQTRDQALEGLVTSLDTLANQFATAINAAQANGFDLNGKAGQNFFTVPATVTGSAASISVAITDPAKVAASSDGAAGSNGNLVNLTAVQTATLPAGQTPSDAYASLVYQVGSLGSNAQSESTASGASLKQLTDQQSSVSGVSIDEEASNLISYQTAYAAAARVVTTVQALFNVTLQMGTAAAE